VKTPVATSNPVDYEYLPLIPLNFKKGNVYTGVFGPTTVAFGPDGNCYFGTQGGDIVRLVLNEQHQVVSSFVSTIVPDTESDSPFRAILGITFDPMDTNEFPKVSKRKQNVLFKTTTGLISLLQVHLFANATTVVAHPTFP
jgi:hypothetical protein